VQSILEGFKWKIDKTYEDFMELQKVVSLHHLHIKGLHCYGMYYNSLLLLYVCTYVPISGIRVGTGETTSYSSIGEKFFF